jgi:hypothetical protein
MKDNRNEAVEALTKLSLGMFEAFMTERGNDLWMRQSLHDERVTKS